MPRFCKLCFGHRDITVYESMWSMAMFHNFGWDELWDMNPWEFDAVISLTSGYLEQQEMLRKQEEANRRAMY